MEKLQQLMRSDELIKELVGRVNGRNEEMFAPLQREYDMYQKQMKDLEQKLSKTFDAYTDELISKAMYADKARNLEEQLLQLKEQIEPLRKQLTANTVENYGF